MSTRRSSRKGSSKNDTTSSSSSTRALPEHVRRRHRSVADREASRLARPDRPSVQTLAHASRSKSAVSSTPFGSFARGKQESSSSSASASTSSEWCGPFSVARQMIAAREAARKKRELEREEDEEKEKEKHPLDAMVKLAEWEKKKKSNPSITWKSRASVVNGSNSGGRGGGKMENLYHERMRRYKRQKCSGKVDQGGDVNDTDDISGEITATATFPSLYDKCVKFLVENFEHVEALGPMVDHTIRRSICHALVASGKMNGAAFDTLAEEGIDTLEITDCTAVTQDAMVEALEKLMPAGLRALILTHAGRCFGSRAVRAILQSASDYTSASASMSSSSSPNKIVDLFALSISGAYLLKDLDASRLIAAASSTLSSIAFTACPLIGTDVCHSLATHYASGVGNGSVLLELSLIEIPLLSKDHFKSLYASSDCLKHLKSLTLRQLDGIDDVVLEGILSSSQTNDNLEYLDIGHNVHLTDRTLSSIRRYNAHGSLRELNLCGLKHMTAIGLQTFFTFGIDGLPPPPALRSLDVSDCHFHAVNDAVMKLAIAASSLKRLKDSKESEEAEEHESIITEDDQKKPTAGQMEDNDNDDENHGSGNIIKSSNSDDKHISDNKHLSALGGMIHLDVSGSSVTDSTMEALASHCATSLRSLKVNFCPHVSNQGLGYLVSKCGRQLSSLEVWGCAQISDVFLDGHDRIMDGGNFAIEGAWMKAKKTD